MLTLEEAKVLIIDDEPKNIQVLASTLSEEGYQIEFTTNGSEAVNWATEDKFDLILLDIMMPELDGYQVCERIKQNKKSAGIPIIFLTARTDQESIVNGFKAGAVDYITKPFKKDELLARVNTHIKLQKSTRKINKLYNETLESLRYAKNIQKTILPSPKILNSILPNNFIFYNQRDIVGGDFFWIKKLENKIYLAVGDSTGHGVPGAMMSVLGVSILNNIFFRIKKNEKASKIVEYFYEQLISYSLSDDSNNNDSIELGLYIIDVKTKQVQFSANNFQTIIVSDKPKINSQILKTEKTKYIEEKSEKKTVEYLKVLSGLMNNEDKANVEFTIDKNDKIYLFSDGITDQFGGEKNKKINRKGILNIIKRYSNISILQQEHKIIKGFVDWKGENEQVDDLILLGFSL